MRKESKKSYKKIFLLLFFTSLLVFVIFFPTWRQDPQIEARATKTGAETQITAPLKQINAAKTQTASAKIETKDEPINVKSVTVIAGDITVQLPFSPDTTFYDALLAGKIAGKIEFAGKNYPGLGFFVTDIGTLHEGDGKNLIYYVNGEEATVGVSTYALQEGNIIEWKLE